MKKKMVGNCRNCKWREGTRCRKLREYINMSDWCGGWSKEEKEEK